MNVRRSKRLLSLKPVPTPDDPPKWEATPMGKAVYESTLPVDAGITLHQRLQAAIEAGLPLGVTIQEGHIPLIFLIIQVWRGCLGGAEMVV